MIEVQNIKEIIDNKVIDFYWNEYDISEVSEISLNEFYKEKKKNDILKIATLTDQLNLMAWILAEQIEAKQEEEITELEKKALEIYKSIQNILNW